MYGIIFGHEKGGKRILCMICVDAGGGRLPNREISAEYVRF